MRVLVVDNCEVLSELLRQAGHEIVSSMASADMVLMNGKRALEHVQEIERLRQQLAERKLVERAKGILMKTRGLDEESAYALMRKAAMDRNLRIGEVAHQLIEAQGLLSGA
jgi:two-component system, response regulator / RNA-binding antiterminator